MREPGVVSRALEQEVRGEVRRQGTVIWLDKDNAYSGFVDGLIARRAQNQALFPVVAFRGSFLELLFDLDVALQPHGDNPDRPHILVHMPGFNEESIRETPVLEMYEPGVRYRKALDTLIREAATGRMAPAEVDRFVATRPTLEAADQWLGSVGSQSTFGLTAALDELGPMLVAEALGQPNSSLAMRVNAPEELQVLCAYLHKLTGIDDAWIESFRNDRIRQPLELVLGALAAWLLCVEYVHDLAREPYLEGLKRLRGLSRPIVNACVEVVGQVRRDNPDAYERIADEVEGTITGELRQMTADDLGQIDTFREEENRILAGAVEALRRGEWSKARKWCEARLGEKSFWLQRDQSRRWAWALVEEAARFGETLAAHQTPLAGASSVEQATERYAAGAYEVDRAHRRFEQQRLMRLEPRLPHFGPLQEVVGVLRRAHRLWADALASEFAALCRDQGFLPPPSKQQRTLFDQVVHPLTLSSDKVALFVIDAFRYEMATELVEELSGTGTVVDLKPRLAELPTITAVGMNVLAPVAEGERLHVAGVFQGFRTGEFTVRKPEDRARAMGLRSVGRPALLLKLAEVCEMATPRLIKDVRSHQLVVVHSKEIDDAGEANVGLPTFESTLRQIKAAWHHLQLAGVKNFVFTADHGFLLKDETTREQPFGNKRTPQRRHIVDEHPRAEAGMVHVSMSSLGYDGLPGYLLLRDDTAVFATGTAGATFVHGGNSLQERVIPVLTVTRKRREAPAHSELMVQVEPQPDVLGHHRLRVRVVTAPGVLGFAGAATVDLAIRAVDREQVRAVLKDVVGPAKVKPDRLEVTVGETWCEVFFGLEGPSDERVRIEVFHGDNLAKVHAASPEERYSVSGWTRAGAKPPAPRVPAETQPAGAWADSIGDEAIRRVFLHIEKHRAITETEVTAMLGGSPRAFRRFSLEFDDHLARLPFRVRIEPGEDGKRYVREDGP